MALVQLPVDIPFAGPADATYVQGHSLLDLLVQASQPAHNTTSLSKRTLVPYFGSSEPASEALFGKKTASLTKSASNVKTRARKSRAEPTSPVRSVTPDRAVKARPAANKPAKVWASCMTSPNPEDVPLPSQALLGRVRSAVF